MMNSEEQLKLQAFLDGELDAAEAAKVQAWLAREPEARQLLAELQNTQSALSGHEAELKLPETRDFFWSKVRREIERQEQAAPGRATARVSWLGWIRGQMLPLSGVALLAVMLSVMWTHSTGESGQPGEIELTGDEMGAYTFRDQAEKMTFIWFYNRTADSQLAERHELAMLDIP